MENRHAIRLRNTTAALWAGFGIPTACIWTLIADQHVWVDRHPVLAIFVLITFVAPLVFIGWLEHDRRKSKRANSGHRRVSMAKIAPREFAPTIVIDDQGRFLLQQRDNIPGIFYPGKIGFFGGHREGNETFLECAVRELHEELGLYFSPERFEFLARYEGPDLAIHGGTLRINFFVVRNVPSDKLAVTEGKPLFVFPEEIRGLEERMTPTSRYGLKAFFEKYPAR
jgi:8-oxo-dGTP diphosphatase